MKKAFAFLLVAASLLLASGAQAQSVHFRVKIPFDFTVGNTVYGAGTYDVDSISPTASNTISMRTRGNGLMFLTSQCDLAKAAESSALLFHKVGDEYFLYRVWNAGNSRGGELSQPKRETVLALNGQKSEDIIVAANLVK